MTTSIGTLPFDLHGRLCIAARDGPVELLRALVKEGVDVDRDDAQGHTALHCAAVCGNVEAVRG
jgi:ankyrin repeat protein